jgi:hypothetical protein
MKKSTLAVIGAFLFSGSLLAHHSWGGIYDLQKQVLLKGRVVKVTYRNPHSTLTIETRNSGTWEGEWTSWDGLSHHGIRENTITVGDFLEILGSPSRPPTRRLWPSIGRFGARPTTGIGRVQTNGPARE